MRTDAPLPSSVGHESLRSTRRAAYATPLVLLAMLLAIPTVLAAQDSAVIVVNPVKETVKELGGHQEASGSTFQISAGTFVKVRAEPSNSALYTCSVTAAVTSLTVPDSLSAWLKTIHDYLPVIFSTQPFSWAALFSGSSTSPPTPPPTALQNLGDFTHGPDGIAGTEQWLLVQLDSLSRLRGAAVTEFSRRLRIYQDTHNWGLERESASPNRSLAEVAQDSLIAIRGRAPGNDTLLYYGWCADAQCHRVPFPTAAVQLTSTIERELRQREEGFSGDSARLTTWHHTVDSLQNRPKLSKRDSASLKVAQGKKAALQTRVKRDSQVVAAEETALQGSAAALGAAYALERLSRRVLGADSMVTCGRAIRVTSDSVKAVTVSIAPDNSTDVKRLNLLAGSDSVQFKLRPPRRWRIEVGVSLLYAPQARFGKPGTTRYGSTDSVQVAVVGQDDYRWTYGLTLGVGPLVNEHGWRLWPELTVNPSSDVRAIGLGAGLSWSIVKVSVGWLWTRHDTFDPSTRPPAVLASADALKTTSRFGGSMFLGFSLLKLPGIFR